MPPHTHINTLSFLSLWLLMCLKFTQFRVSHHLHRAAYIGCWCVPSWWLKVETIRKEGRFGLLMCDVCVFVCVKIENGTRLCHREHLKVNMWKEEKLTFSLAHPEKDRQLIWILHCHSLSKRLTARKQRTLFRDRCVMLHDTAKNERGIKTIIFKAIKICSGGSVRFYCP